MFNTFCWLLNVIGLACVAAALRRIALRLLASHARRWDYSNPDQIGYWGGVDVPIFGTVAFIPYVAGNRDVPYLFTW